MRTNAKRLVKQVLLAALVLAPMGASAADADLLVEIVPPGFTDRFLFARTDPNPGKITIGQTKEFFIDITNNGPSTAVGIDVQKPTLDSKFEIVSVDGCVLQSFKCVAADTSPLCKSPLTGIKVGETVIDPNDARSWPCKIANLTDAPGSDPDAPTNVAEVTVDVMWPGTPDNPDTKAREDIPTVCPDTLTLAPTVANVTMSTDAGSTTDPTLANNTATNTPVAAPEAYLEMGVATDIGSGGPGSQFTMEGTIKNLGPCLATDVRARDVDGSADGKIELVAGQTTGCNAIPDDPATTTKNEAVAAPDINPVTKGCRVGDMAPNTTKTFRATYTIGSMLSDELQRATTLSLNVYSTGFSYESTSASAPAGRTYDPDETDNVASANIVSKQDVSSCSTGGLPGVLGLLLVAMPLVRRRRNR